jgi:imidazoleglycerol phosphate dehydratase HisB
MSLVRKATLSRKTNETDINIELCLDSAGDQAIDVNSGIGFLNHVTKLINCPILFYDALIYQKNIYIYLLYGHRCIMLSQNILGGHYH